MSINPKTQEDQDDLNKRLRSLKIDRGPAPSPTANNRSPKVLLLALSALVALVAVVGYLYFSSAAKPISVAEVKWKGGKFKRDTVRLSQGMCSTQHKIAVGAKVMGRVACMERQK